MANVIEFSIKGIDKFSSVMNRVRKGLNTLAKVAIVKFAVLSGVALLAAKSLIRVGDTTEKLRIRMNAMLGSTEEGAKVFKDMSDFASKVPFAYEEIMESATALSGVLKGGSEEINRTMPLIADLAAVSGLSIQDTTQQIIRMYSAGAGAADLFRERGILSMLGFKAGVSVSAEETKRKLIEAFEDPASKFKGAAGKLATTWSGIMSMIGDKWFAMRSQIADAGVFNYFKALAIVIDKHMGKALENTKNNAVIWANTIINAVRSVMNVVGFVADMFRGLGVVWKGLEVLFAITAEFILASLAKITRDVSAFISLIPGIDIGPFKVLEASVGMASKRTSELKKELKELVETPMPSEKIAEFSLMVEEAFVSLEEMASSSMDKITEVADLNKTFIEEIFIALEGASLTWLEKMKEHTTEFATSFFNLMTTIIDQISDRMADAIVEGKSMTEAFKGFAKQVLKTLISMLIKMAIQRAIVSKTTQAATTSETSIGGGKAVGLAGANMFASMAGAPYPINLTAPAAAAAALAGAGASLSAGIASGSAIGAANTPREHGGPVGIGQSYLVGERGPELFSPNSNGAIIPNNRLGGGGVSIGSLNIVINLPELDTVEALKEMDSNDWQDVVAGPLYEAVDNLARKGVKPSYLEG